MSERPRICVLLKMGSCAACPVPGEVLVEMRRNGREPKAVLDSFSKKNCPEGSEVQMPRKGRLPFFVR